MILVVLDVLGHLPDRIRGMQAALRAAYPGYVQVLNLGVLIVPVFFLLLLRQGLFRKREAVRLKSSS